MKVTLLSYTKNAANLCATAAQTCYSKDTLEGRIKNGKVLTPSGVDKRLAENIESGHHSVIEHASYTFEIDGISRTLSHQIVRHRIASFSQQSQRYVDMDEPTFVIPPSIAENTMAMAIFDRIMRECWEAYAELGVLNIPNEDARFVLPNACTTNMIMTMNARELLHFFELRMCNRAQWEIRDVANSMYSLCMEVSPEIFKHAGPKCWFGKCTEKVPCGKPKPVSPISSTMYGTLFC